MRVGIDIMGGDYFPQAPIEGVIRARKRYGDEVTLVLIGDRTLIGKELEQQGSSPDQFEIIHTEEYIGMSESPAKAVAGKKASSINVGVGLLKSGQLDAFLSAGNTGAMLVASIIGLGNIPGVERPTLGVLFRNLKGELSLLCDAGANVDCRPDHLVQFGVLGSVFMESVGKIEAPRVTLMNVGEEPSKGNAAVREAYKKLSDRSDLNFVGNSEGRDFLQGGAHVFVCDGFTGNILLKFGESFYEILTSRYEDDTFAESFNFENYGGVPILGVNGISVIGHGISNGKAIEAMIKSAIDAVNSGLVDKIRTAFSQES